MEDVYNDVQVSVESIAFKIVLANLHSIRVSYKFFQELPCLSLFLGNRLVLHVIAIMLPVKC